MVVFSSLRRSLLTTVNLTKTRKTNVLVGSLIKRSMGGHGHTRKMVIEPTNWHFLKAVDQIHLYSCVALAIFGSVILYCNIFIGDAELQEIPEGYIPKYWEYYEHPITRFIAYLQGDPQKYYENWLHHLFHDHWDLKLTELDTKVKWEMKKHKDYKAYYYRAISANNLRTYAWEEKYEPERTAMETGQMYFPTDFKDDGDWPDQGH